MDTVDLINEMIAEDTEGLNRIFKEDFEPLMEHKKRLEREVFDKALSEVEKLEREP